MDIRKVIEEYPKKYKEENQFIRMTKNEYLFGEETIKVKLVGDDVILKLNRVIMNSKNFSIY